MNPSTTTHGTNPAARQPARRVKTPMDRGAEDADAADAVVEVGAGESGQDRPRVATTTTAVATTTVRGTRGAT